MLSPDTATPLDTLTRAELEAIASEPYERRGIIHSEMAILIHICRKLGVEVFLESGRARAQSTYMIAKYLPNAEIHSIEGEPDHPDEAFAKQRLKQFSNVTLYEGDGVQGLISFSGKVGPRPTAVLCDGPKGVSAIATLKLCLRFQHVKAGFVHDIRKGDKANPDVRDLACRMLPSPIFSDDPELVAALSWMDDSIVAAKGPAGAIQQKLYGCHGPTLGAFINNKNQPL